jgi:hypothetical protein
MKLSDEERTMNLLFFNIMIIVEEQCKFEHNDNSRIYVHVYHTQQFFFIFRKYNTFLSDSYMITLFSTDKISVPLSNFYLNLLIFF